jgi:hypothetical protein
MPNTAAYPQPRSQKPGLGFPLGRLGGHYLPVQCAAVLDMAIGRYRGKGTDGSVRSKTLELKSKVSLKRPDTKIYCASLVDKKAIAFAMVNKKPLDHRP